jgi:cell fate regulator YaaT (PSP1 superfamily)
MSRFKTLSTSSSGKAMSLQQGLLVISMAAEDRITISEVADSMHSLMKSRIKLSY